MKTHTKKSDAAEVGKLVALMVRNPEAQFGIYENEIYHKGELVCKLETHGKAMSAIQFIREQLSK